MSGHLFISYSRSDRAYVERLAAHLTEAGCLVWYDHEIAAAEPFGPRIEKAIEGCVAMLLVMSPEAVSSEWVRREISFADAAGKRIYPLLLAPCKAPIEVHRTQHEDVTGGRMPRAQFVDQLRGLSGTAPATSGSRLGERQIVAAVRELIGPHSWRRQLERLWIDPRVPVDIRTTVRSRYKLRSSESIIAVWMWGGRIFDRSSSGLAFTNEGIRILNGDRLDAIPYADLASYQVTVADEPGYVQRGTDDLPARVWIVLTRGTTTVRTGLTRKYGTARHVAGVLRSVGRIVRVD